MIDTPSGPSKHADHTAAAAGRLRVFFGDVGRPALERALARAARGLVAAGSDVAAADAPLAPRELERLEVRGGSALDLDRALARRPAVLLLPDLAGVNLPGARHRRRHQDVQELLAAGIEVWTTLDVRELEGLVEVVTQITGAAPTRTLPDAVFDRAERVELVDEVEAGADAAPGDLWRALALREVTLRRAADRLAARAIAAGPARPPWRTRERLLVCVGSSPTSARVVRAASRLAAEVRAPWLAVNVALAPSAVEERRVAQHLELAETLGGEAVSLSGSDVAEELVRYARARDATRIVIGKAGALAGWPRRSLVARVIAASGDIDVHVVRGGEDGDREVPARLVPSAERGARGYGAAGLVLAVSTAVAAAFSALGLAEANLVLSYLLGVAAVGAWYGRGPAVFFSFAAVLAFNFFFIAPRYTLRVDDTQYLFTFGVMLAIGLLVSTLTARVRAQSEAARVRQRQTEALYRVTQELSAAAGLAQVAAAGERLVGEALRVEAAVLVAGEEGRLTRVVGDPWPDEGGGLERAASWAYARGAQAGAGTATHAEAGALALPLATPAGPLGALLVRASAPELLVLPGPRRALETIAGQVAQAIQRERLAEGIHRATAAAEAEKLRNALLTSVSHDLRTPLASIAGASSSLIEAGEGLGPEVRADLLGTIFAEADRLSRFVDNLLQMTRIASGRADPRREWHVAEDLIGSALTRLSGHLAGRQVTTRVEDGLPLVAVDGVLIEHLLVNLLENAAKYSPPAARIEVSARALAGALRVEVADRGPGVPDAEKERVFEKFERGSGPGSRGARGAGLGLTICRAIAQLHGGRVWVEDRAGGGARFCVDLPLEDQPPALGDELPEAARGAEVAA